MLQYKTVKRNTNNRVQDNESSSYQSKITLMGEAHQKNSFSLVRGNQKVQVNESVSSFYVFHCKPAVLIWIWIEFISTYLNDTVLPANVRYSLKVNVDPMFLKITFFKLRMKG